MGERRPREIELEREGKERSGANLENEQGRQNGNWRNLSELNNPQVNFKLIA